MKVLILGFISFLFVSCGTKRPEYFALAPYSMTCEKVKDFSDSIDKLISSGQLVNEKGFKITSIGDTFFLKKGRFKVGDVIEKVDGKSVKSERKLKQTFAAMSKECRKFRIGFDRGKGLHYIDIRVIPNQPVNKAQPKEFKPRKKGSKR